jgi:hypothetical protein
MHRPRLPCLPLSVALLCAAASPGVAHAQGATVYRCTDARGKVELRDSPCAKDKLQTTRKLVRMASPPPPRRLAPVRVDAPPVASAPPQYVFVTAPRPLYECVTPDGDRYTSDSPEGNPRWMPLWALDYPVLAQRNLYRPGGASIRYRDGRVDARVRSGGVERRVVPTIAAYGNAGTWVRDACSALPPREACDQLRDRRDELRRQAFNAQPSDRAVLEREERGINARLSQDCGGR